MDLFSHAAERDLSNAPLPERARPRALAGVVGQGHPLGEGKPLRRALEQDLAPSLIIGGPPGTRQAAADRATRHAERRAPIVGGRPAPGSCTRVERRTSPPSGPRGAQDKGALPVPMRIRTATSRTKKMSYCAGQKHPQRFEGSYVAGRQVPDGPRGNRHSERTENSFESEPKERLDRIKASRG
ncbi:MAG: hypothetical protein ACOX6T_07170 [Myxococcales bacterium]|jgi:replication-associated recombination protein RarA